jgi:hypothetical protein
MPKVEVVGTYLETIDSGALRAAPSRATEAAWALRPARVWLHTCTLDDAAALPNDVARGFRPFKSETYQAELVDPAGG